MNYKIMIVVCLLSFHVCLVPNECDEYYVYAPLTKRDLRSVLRKQDLVIAYAFQWGEGETEERSQAVQKNIECLESYAVDNNGVFELAKVQCLAINWLRGDLDRVQRKNKIYYRDALLFYRDQKLEACQELVGPLTKQNLHEFLKNVNFNDFLQSKLQSTQKELKRAKERRRCYSCCYGGWGGCGGWGYPCGFGWGYRPMYGYGGYPYYRPGFGVYFGCGGCC